MLKDFIFLALLHRAEVPKLSWETLFGILKNDIVGLNKTGPNAHVCGKNRALDRNLPMLLSDVETFRCCSRMSKLSDAALKCRNFPMLLPNVEIFRCCSRRSTFSDATQFLILFSKAETFRCFSRTSNLSEQ